MWERDIGAKGRRVRGCGSSAFATSRAGIWGDFNDVYYTKHYSELGKIDNKYNEMKN
jgi:hypothetical protein